MIQDVWDPKLGEFVARELSTKESVLERISREVAGTPSFGDGPLDRLKVMLDMKWLVSRVRQLQAHVRDVCGFRIESFSIVKDDQGMPDEIVIRRTWGKERNCLTKVYASSSLIGEAQDYTREAGARATALEGKLKSVEGAFEHSMGETRVACEERNEFRDRVAELETSLGTAILSNDEGAEIVRELRRREAKFDEVRQRVQDRVVGTIHQAFGDRMDFEQAKTVAGAVRDLIESEMGIDESQHETPIEIRAREAEARVVELKEDVRLLNLNEGAVTGHLAAARARVAEVEAARDDFEERYDHQYERAEANHRNGVELEACVAKLVDEAKVNAAHHVQVSEAWANTETRARKAEARVLEIEAEYKGLDAEVEEMVDAVIKDEMGVWDCVCSPNPSHESHCPVLLRSEVKTVFSEVALLRRRVATLTNANVDLVDRHIASFTARAVELEHRAHQAAIRDPVEYADQYFLREDPSRFDLSIFSGGSFDFSPATVSGGTAAASVGFGTTGSGTAPGCSGAAEDGAATVVSGATGSGGSTGGAAFRRSISSPME